MSELEGIYYNYQNDLDTGDSEDVETARKSLYAFLEEKGLTVFECEDFVGCLSSESEKQGFLNGFKYAMKIAMECMQTKTA